MTTPDTFDSLRDYIAAVDELGLLRRIDGADWNVEIGALTETVAFTDRPHALLFDDIEQYPRGYRVVTNSFVSEQLQALALGLDPSDSGIDLVEQWRVQQANHERLEPRPVRDGPVRENVLTGDEIDLLSFPVPQWREQDGGRYFGTGDVTFTRDPDSGWVNAAVYRAQVQDADVMTVEIAETHHGRIHLEKHWERGEAAPIVMTGGQDPYTYAGGCMPLPHGYPELEFAGGLKGQPIETIVDETTGLPVPATAEIAIIGHVPPPEERSLDEGPFGECTGYFTHGGEQPVVRIDEIWHRNDPILQGNLTMHGSAMRHSLGGELVSSARMWDAIEDEVPNVQGVYSLYQQCQQGSHVTAVSIDQAYAGHAKQAAVEIAGTMANGTLSRAVIVVDDDIDPSSWEDVLFAFATRCDPGRDIDIVTDMPSSHLDTRISPDRMADGDVTTSTMLVDACVPYQRLDSFPESNHLDRDLRAEMIDKWDVDSWADSVE